jgi:phosphatidate cytidylyltransferase
MLRQRILTAVVLALVLVASLSWSLLAFSGVIALAAGVAMFEWLRLARLGDRVTIPAGAVFGALLLLAQATMPGLMPAAAPVLCGLAAAGWIAVGALLVRAQTRGVQVGPTPLVLLAVLFLLAAWAALQSLLAGGAVELLSAMAIVWLADIAAYFFGRAFGRRKLASRISPGKTWAGAWGALGAVIAVAFLARSAWPAAPLVTNGIIGAAGALAAAGLFVLLVAASIVGDLFESLLKRQAGVKDSSKLLPGHGGVLDRIDALLPVLPLVVLIQRWPA